MQLFGVLVPLPIALIGFGVLILLIALIIFSIIKPGANKEPEDLDKRETYGDFHGLLTQEDFDTRADDHLLEMYRKQWIQAPPGDEKDNYLLLYLALKQLNKEQNESEDEWTQEQCEARMDEIIAELSEKTGLKPLIREIPESEFEAYFNEDEEATEEETSEKDEKEE